MTDSVRDRAVDALRVHWVTNNSEVSGGNYRVWVTCRCGWTSPDLTDPNIPARHRAHDEHRVDVLAAAGLLVPENKE